MATQNKTGGGDKALKQFYQKNKLIINGVVILTGTFILMKQIRKWRASGKAWRFNPNLNTQTTIKDPITNQDIPIDINLYRKAEEFYQACWNYAYGTMEDEDTMLKVIKSVPCQLMPRLAQIYASTYGENLYSDVVSYMPSSYVQEAATHCPSYFG